MKICIINNLYKPFERGGAEKVSEILVHGLKNAGHEVFVVTTKPFFKSIHDIQSDTKIYWIQSLLYSLKNIPFFIRVVWHILDMFDVSVYWKVKKVIKKEKPDLVISGNLKGLSFLLPRLFSNFEMRHIHVLHDIQLMHPSGLMYFQKEKILDTFFAKMYQRFNIFLFKDVRYIISPSTWLMNEHQKRGFFKKAETFIFLNPIESEECVKDKKRTSDFIFLFVGHLTKAKGVETLLRAYNELKSSAEQDKVGLILAGTDFLDKEMRTLALNLGVKILGFQNSEKIKSLMFSSDCLVVPSRVYENSPTVICEAVSRDLRFITSNIGGAKELAEKFDSQIFRPGDYEDLAEQMKIVIKKPPLVDCEKQFFREITKELKIEKYVARLLKIVA